MTMYTTRDKTSCENFLKRDPEEVDTYDFLYFLLESHLNREACTDRYLRCENITEEDAMVMSRMAFLGDPGPFNTDSVHHEYFIKGYLKCLRREIAP